MRSHKKKKYEPFFGTRISLPPGEIDNELLTEDYPAQQVIHTENQVTSLKQLRAGSKCRFVSTMCSILRMEDRPILVYVRREGEWLVFRSVTGDKTTFLITTVGIKPYEDGTWNPHNYLVKVK